MLYNQYTDEDQGDLIQLSEYVSAFTEDMRTDEQKENDDIFHLDWVDEVMRTTLLLEEPSSDRTFLLSPNNVKYIFNYLIENGNTEVANDILDFYMNCVDVKNSVPN